jgi:hypothetical protein
MDCVRTVGPICSRWYLLIYFAVNFLCLFVCLFRAAWDPAAVTILGDRAANLDLCLALMAFSSKGSFFAPHLLRHRISVYTISSEGPAPMSHSGIRTDNVKTIISLHLHSNHSPRGRLEFPMWLHHSSYLYSVTSNF